MCAVLWGGSTQTDGSKKTPHTAKTAYLVDGVDVGGTLRRVLQVRASLGGTHALCRLQELVQEGAIGCDGAAGRGGAEGGRESGWRQELWVRLTAKSVNA